MCCGVKKEKPAVQILVLANANLLNEWQEGEESCCLSFACSSRLSVRFCRQSFESETRGGVCVTVVTESPARTYFPAGERETRIREKGCNFQQTLDPLSRNPVSRESFDVQQSGACSVPIDSR